MKPGCQFPARVEGMKTEQLNRESWLQPLTAESASSPVRGPDHIEARTRRLRALFSRGDPFKRGRFFVGDL